MANPARPTALNRPCSQPDRRQTMRAVPAPSGRSDGPDAPRDRAQDSISILERIQGTGAGTPG